MATTRNQAFLTVPASLEDSAAIEFVLNRLIEQIDIIRGLRDSRESEYVTKKDLDRALTNVESTPTQTQQEGPDNFTRLLKASIESLTSEVQVLRQLYESLNTVVVYERVPYPEEDGKMYVMKDKQWVELR